MRILQINTFYKNGGSTGRIVYDLKCLSQECGIDSYVAYGFEFITVGDDHTYRMCSIPEMQWNKIRTRLWPRHAFYNVKATKRLIKYMDKIKPDVLHLHNLHNHYLNIGLLFQYIKKNNIPVVWTLHDCWSFTGWCAYFDMANCEKWKTGCKGKCPCIHDYPYTWFFCRSKQNYLEKKNTFCGVENLILVTPSQWLADLTRDSFLKNYSVKVINNGVDTCVFKPSISDVRVKYDIPANGHLILAVINVWSKRKGADILLQLQSLLNDDEYLIVVGIKPKQKSLLSHERCIGICRTNSVEELTAIYSASDVFINPTFEDNFPTTNLEALACGTPVVTFETGGSVESIDEKCGLIVPKGDVLALLNAIRTICARGKETYSAQCRNKALKLYNKITQYRMYIELYEKMVSK